MSFEGGDPQQYIYIYISGGSKVVTRQKRAQSRNSPAAKRLAKILDDFSVRVYVLFERGPPKSVPLPQIIP